MMDRSGNIDWTEMPVDGGAGTVAATGSVSAASARSISASSAREGLPGGASTRLSGSGAVTASTGASSACADRRYAQTQSMQQARSAVFDRARAAALRQHSGTSTLIGDDGNFLNLLGMESTPAAQPNAAAARAFGFRSRACSGGSGLRAMRPSFSASNALTHAP